MLDRSDDTGCCRLAVSGDEEEEEAPREDFTLLCSRLADCGLPRSPPVVVDGDEDARRVVGCAANGGG